MSDCTYCDKPARTRGLCTTHYSRLRRGLPLDAPVRIVGDLEARFWQKVQPADADECWIWIGAKNEDGYGEIRVNRKTKRAYHVAYSLLIGDIPDGLQPDHTCRVRACVNPWHLDPVTSRVNTLRGEGPTARWAARDRCEQGHEFTDENTMIRTNGARRCRECRRAEQREPVPCDQCSQMITRSNLRVHKKRRHPEIVREAA